MPFTLNSWYLYFSVPFKLVLGIQRLAIFVRVRVVFKTYILYNSLHNFLRFPCYNVILLEGSTLLFANWIEV